jgi:predicted nucleic acid-binding protein
MDTSGWVALKHKGDTFWQTATTLHRALLTARARYVTSNFVLDEAYTLLLHRAGHHVAVELGEEIRASRVSTALNLSHQLTGDCSLAGTRVGGASKVGLSPHARAE